MSVRRFGALILTATLSACSSSKPEAKAGGATGGAGANGGSNASAEAGASGEGGANGEVGSMGMRSIPVFDKARISSLQGDPNYQEVTADIDWSGGPYQRATLVADLETTCVPFSTWAVNRPPRGQNWPADCDAFDRNFEISLDDQSAGRTDRSTPAIELIRAITPFGGPLHLERDVTAVVNASAETGHVRARINTFSDPAGLVTGSAAGWNLSLHVELVRGPAARPLAVVPLFYGDVVRAGVSSASFTTPKGTRSAYLEYRTTGHGQAAGDSFSCIGPAEEFCKRQHTLKLDGVTVKSFTPWKSCAAGCTLAKTDGVDGFTYCEQNPCGAVASVKAPRANWCPGSETLPVVIDAPALAEPGPHTLTWQVSEIAQGGSVRVSLTYFAFGD